MNKRLVGILFLISCITLASIFFHDNELRKRAGRVNPGYLSSYPESGYYKINSDTILASLNQNQTNVFLPLSEDPWTVEPLSGVDFQWSQNDYLKIASALGEFVWNDPMSLDDWNIYWLLFEGDCEISPKGFYLADIVYYKTIEINGKKTYTTRLVEITPYLNWVRWGSGANYPIPILSRWKNVNLVNSITADEAVRIADENGGKDARLQKDNQYCSIYIHSPNYDRNAEWYVSYYTSGNDFEMYVPMK